MSYRVILDGRNFTRISQPGVSLRAQRMRWTAFGGAEDALITASGSPALLSDLASFLRCPVTIYNAMGMPVWWGFLNGLSYPLEGNGVGTTAGGRVSVSLDGMANRVAVYHTSPAALDQPGESHLTDWAEDSTSQAHYGVKEKIIRRVHIDESFALQLRDLSLSQLKNPQIEMQPGAVKADQPMQAELDCRGWMHTLFWKGYQTQAGLIGNTVAQSGTQMLGDASNRLRLAQSFLPEVGIAVNAVDVRLKREGSPTDTLTLSLQADSSGSPSGTALGSASLSGSALEDESYPWVRFTFDLLVELSAGMRYWLVLARSGAVSSTSYYLAGVDEGLAFTAGRFRLYDQSASTWVSRVPSCDLVFRVLGSRETSSQLADIYTEGNQFMTGFDCRAASGVMTPPFEVGMDTCQETFEKLLQLGTVNNRLMTARVTPERRLVVTEQPEHGVRDHFLDAQGRFYDPHGNRLMPGFVPVGEWVRMKGASAAAMFVSQAEVDGESGKVNLQVG